jgi:hypothetical protein
MLSRGAVSIVDYIAVSGLGVVPTHSDTSFTHHYKIVGLGLSVVNDELGPTDETYVAADFSYTIPVRFMVI